MREAQRAQTHFVSWGRRTTAQARHDLRLDYLDETVRERAARRGALNHSRVLRGERAVTAQYLTGTAAGAKMREAQWGPTHFVSWGRKCVA